MQIEFGWEKKKNENRLLSSDDIIGRHSFGNGSLLKRPLSLSYRALVLCSSVITLGGGGGLGEMWVCILAAAKSGCGLLSRRP